MKAMNHNAAVQALSFSIAISFLNETQDIRVLDLMQVYSQPDQGVEFLLVVNVSSASLEAISKGQSRMISSPYSCVIP